MSLSHTFFEYLPNQSLKAPARADETAPENILQDAAEELKKKGLFGRVERTYPKTEDVVRFSLYAELPEDTQIRLLSLDRPLDEEERLYPCTLIQSGISSIPGIVELEKEPGVRIWDYDFRLDVPDQNTLEHVVKLILSSPRNQKALRQLVSI